MTPLFKRFGIDLDQLKILIINAIRIDFRESRGIGIKRRKISPIVWSLIFYLICLSYVVLFHGDDGFCCYSGIWSFSIFCG